MLLDKIFSYPLNQIDTLQTDESHIISYNTMLNITWHVQTWFEEERGEYINKREFFALKEIGDGWIETRGNYRGTFVKRYEKWIKDKFDVKIPENLKTIVGQKARSDIANSIQVQFDIVNKMDWRAGDFGDDGSCFWRENQRAKDIFLDHPDSFRFLRVFSPEKSRVIITKAKDPNGNLQPVAFNLYGLDDSKFRPILSKLFDALTIRVNLYNQHDALPLFLNGNIGYVISNTAEVERGDYTVPIDTRGYRQAECTSCGELIKDNNYYFDRDNNIVCWECSE